MKRPTHSEPEDVLRHARRGKHMSRKHPRRILTLWARLGLLVLCIGVLAMAAVGLVAKAIRPYREASIQQYDLSTTQRQINLLTEDNTDLARRIAYLQTADGKASEARKMGYVRPGEIPLVVDGFPNQWTPVPTASPSSDDTPSWKAKALSIWHAIAKH